MPSPTLTPRGNATFRRDTQGCLSPQPLPGCIRSPEFRRSRPGYNHRARFEAGCSGPRVVTLLVAEERY